MFPSLALFSRTTYRGSSGSGAGRSGLTSFRSSPDSKRSATPADVLWMKRSQRGLYHGVQMQSGHNIPKSRQKTKRLFAPNVQNKQLYSEILGKTIEIKLTTKALRTIQKKGGLDAYLSSTKEHELGLFGVQMRNEMASIAKGIMTAREDGSKAVSVEPSPESERPEGRKAQNLVRRLLNQGHSDSLLQKTTFWNLNKSPAAVQESKPSGKN
ncbi:unnamed protein product [Sympodiomycopsis kandeliae]